MNFEPRPVDDAPHSSAERIDSICDQFEDSWRNGERPALRSFMDLLAGVEQRRLVQELVQLDIEYRRRSGETPQPADYLCELPEFSDEIQVLEFSTGHQQDATRTLGDSGRRPAIERAPGEYLAHFRLVELLGAGGGGEVWKAWDTRLSRDVAIKLLRDPTPNESQRQRFIREARAAARLPHDHIVPVYEVDKFEGTVYIVAKFIEGRDLGKQCQQQRPTLRQAARICAEAAGAIQAAHDAGIIHRDLKPANILMDRDGRPFVADFGIAKWADDAGQLTLAGEIIGTPAYMAPEQARGDADAVDERTDVYALGAVLYQTLTGRPPFEGETAAVLRAVDQEEPLAPRRCDARIPRDLETICLRAMDKEPSRRYATARQMADDLGRYLNGESIHARRASVVEKTWRKVRRRPAAALAAASLVLLLVASGFAFSLANENRALTGIQTVKLATDPPGAEVVFVPLDPHTGDPQPQQLIACKQTSPVEQLLKPGSYLVVAHLPESGRFHEVFRYVPTPEETISASYGHQHWEREGQTITLPKILIPELNVSDGMALVPGDVVDSAAPLMPGQPRSRRRVPAVYFDPTEFSVGGLEKLEMPLPIDLRWTPRPANYALTADYHRSLSLAEQSGKRLPSKAEFELAAQWGEARVDAGGKRQPVGQPAEDVVEFDRSVFGLHSNVAEWTTSVPGQLPASEESPLRLGPSMFGRRIVKGGHVPQHIGEGLVTPSTVAGVEFVMEGTRHVEWLGFRCVRSVRPRLKPEDFEQLLAP